MNQHQSRIHLKEIQGDQSATTNTYKCYSYCLILNFNFVMMEDDCGLYSIKVDKHEDYLPKKLMSMVN
jgi:hypothetical protein